MSSNSGFSKKILSLLATRPAISKTELVEQLECIVRQDLTIDQKYALTRSLKGLEGSGLVESHYSGQNEYARLTKDGRKKAFSLKLEDDTVLVNPNWDGKWRIVLLDVPEERKSEREALRYLLKKAGFVCLKNSVWISMQPFEHFFMNIKKDLGLSTEIMIFVTDTLDSTTEEEFLKLIKK